MRTFTILFLFIVGILTSTSIAQDSVPTPSFVESENVKKEDAIDCDCKCPPPPPPPPAPVCGQIIEISNSLSDVSIKKALDAIERAENTYGE